MNLQDYSHTRKLHHGGNEGRLPHNAMALGAKVIIPTIPIPRNGWFAVLTDPQINPTGLWQEDTRAV